MTSAVGVNRHDTRMKDADVEMLKFAGIILLLELVFLPAAFVDHLFGCIFLVVWLAISGFIVWLVVLFLWVGMKVRFSLKCLFALMTWLCVGAALVSANWDFCYQKVFLERLESRTKMVLDRAAFDAEMLSLYSVRATDDVSFVVKQRDCMEKYHQQLSLLCLTDNDRKNAAEMGWRTASLRDIAGKASILSSLVVDFAANQKTVQEAELYCKQVEAAERDLSQTLVRIEGDSRFAKPIVCPKQITDRGRECVIRITF